MAADCWAPGHGCVSANASLADPCYSALGTQAVFLKRRLFPSGPCCTCWASSSACPWLPWLLGLGTGGVGWCSLCACPLFSGICLNRNEPLEHFQNSRKKGEMTRCWFSSGCFIQVITPLDGSFLFLPVLVPLYKWKQVPSIGGVNLEILVNCWEWEKERCIALQAILISLILAECKGAGLDINLFHVLLRLFCTFPSTQHSHPTAARRGWGQSCISQMDTEGMYKDY